MLRGSTRHAPALAVVLAAAALALPSSADEPKPPGAGAGAASADAPESEVGRLPELTPAPALGALFGRTITRVEVLPVGGRWEERPSLRFVRAGDTLTSELARRAMLELTDTGRFANVSADAEADGAGVALRLKVVPRRIVASIRVAGGVLDTEETLRAARVRSGSEVTAAELAGIARRVQDQYVRRGHPTAAVRIDAIDTDDPLRVVLLLDIVPGEPRRVASRRFFVWPNPKVEGLAEVLSSYAVGVRDRADDDDLVAANRELEKALRARGWHRAAVRHTLAPTAAGTELRVDVKAGPLVRLKFEGIQRFDASQIERTLELEKSDDRGPAALAERIQRFYVERGFLDVEVKSEERGAADAPIHDLVFKVREQAQIRIVGREYPCLSGSRSAREVGSEVDSFLSEELPGSGILSSVDPRVMDQTFGPLGTTGARPVPFEPNPWMTYVPEVYERAMKHLQDLYRSEGYLSAMVGPAQLMRRRCDPHSPAGRCVPLGSRRRPKTACTYDEVGLPQEEPPPDAAMLCVPDPKKGVSCEPDAVLHLPIKLGPRTYLYDVGFEGNKLLVEKDLEELAELSLGKPASQVELDKARRRLLDAYAEEGFAFAEVDAALELSPDRTRARAVFTISERERVKVSRIVIVGARVTNESLIRSRVALEVGKFYRRSDVRKTEERLASLGVFGTVTVGLEDPYVPAKEKAVVITVQERMPQYLDIRPGFSTGEGFRIAFEYGHRNLGGEAIPLTLRVQLGYLPNELILEEDVRKKYDELDVGQRLERRNSALVEFPDVGLGPLFRLSVEGLDVRDNARDFGLTKDAGIVTLTYRPVRQFSAFVGGSLELNDASIFGSEQKGALEQYVQANPRRAGLFRVPEGTTLAVAERIGFSWDRRDNPLGATKGTLVTSSIEHVRATPFGGEEAGEGVFDATTSQFLRLTQRVAGYIRLSDKGLALAGSVRWGMNQQLIDRSRTYPDRLFFLGGVDSVRGFNQDSMIPEDIAQQLLDPASGLQLSQVVIRGGDAFVNPRLELRVPLSGNVQTGLFLDSGNLWRDPEKVNPLSLRYAVGSGLRITTPIGPLVFDYGFNVDRVLDELYPQRTRQRYWEPMGAFHFSIGLF
ncbi:MAG: BamA/TamA family outer membrane protein [Polyangiaceae bacterium]|nr:BamA/TamA family outer membrane protein [Polyangiaceae bacterium]